MKNQHNQDLNPIHEFQFLQFIKRVPIFAVHQKSNLHNPIKTQIHKFQFCSSSKTKPKHNSMKTQIHEGGCFLKKKKNLTEPYEHPQ